MRDNGAVIQVANALARSACAGSATSAAAVHGWRPLYTVRCLMGGIHPAV